MIITLNSPDEIETAAKNGYYILRKYAEAVDHFNAVHGYSAKDCVDYWRERAKEFLLNPGGVMHFKEVKKINFEYGEQKSSEE